MLLQREKCVQYNMVANVKSCALKYLAPALAGVLLFCGVMTGQMVGDPAAQNVAPPVAAPPPSSAPLPPLNFDAVMASASSQSSFTFDRSMLQAADGFFAGSDPETRRVVAGLNSITVHNFHARDFARYDPGALAFIDDQMRGAGWKHLVNANGKAASTMTDLWLHYQGANVTNVTVLTRGDRNMSVITVDCTLRPLDLMHLSGHFGIPKVDENAVMVPAR